MPREGRWVISRTVDEVVRSFVPPTLPPDPAVDLARLARPLEAATTALGRLDGLIRMLPDPHLFLYGYVRKEAVLSAQIEGTQSSLSDLLFHELDMAPGVPLDDVREVSRYVAAMDEGIRLLNEGLPLSSRMLRNIHAVLMTGSRGAERTPGEFRRSQNWIGGTRPGNARFVPPPPEEVPELIADLERFLHADDRLPKLVKAGIAHVQFETIHPFLDGNGRLGRLLITFYLYHQKILSEPLLYISLFLKTHRERYYELLQEVRLSGDWEGWLEFFLAAVETTADGAARTASTALRLFEADRQVLQSLGRHAGTALRVHAWLQAHPLTTIKACAAGTGLTLPPVGQALETMTDRGIAREVTGRKRDRVFAYRAYLDLLREDEAPSADAAS